MARVVKALRARRGGGTTLLAYRNGNRWIGVRAGDINQYIKERLGDDFSAKDFRTWNATVLAAVLLADDAGRRAPTGARRRAIDAAVRRVSEALGNTPAVARRAYIDPRVFDRYRSGDRRARPAGERQRGPARSSPPRGAGHRPADRRDPVASGRATVSGTRIASSRAIARSRWGTVHRPAAVGLSRTADELRSMEPRAGYIDRAERDA